MEFSYNEVVPEVELRKPLGALDTNQVLKDGFLNVVQSEAEDIIKVA